MTARIARRRRLPACLVRDERGFTVIELAVTMLVMSVVSAAVFGVFHSLLRSDRYQQALVNNQEKVRFTLLEFTKDVRNANPLLSLASVNDYATKLEVALGPSDGTQQYIRWELTSDNRLTRSEITGPQGTVVDTRLILDNVDNSSMGITLFKYFDSDGAEITTAQTTGDYANCTIRVEVSVGATDDPIGSRFVETDNAEIRNRLPGGIGC